MTDEHTEHTPHAENVAEILDRFEQQNWNRHTANSYETVEAFAREVVEKGTFTPEAKVTAELPLTPKERITGRREQDMTAMVVLGMMLGSALERDVPMDSDLEDRWRNGEFELP